MYLKQLSSRNTTNILVIQPFLFQPLELKYHSLVDLFLSLLLYEDQKVLQCHLYKTTQFYYLIISLRIINFLWISWALLDTHIADDSDVHTITHFCTKSCTNGFKTELEHLQIQGANSDVIYIPITCITKLWSLRRIIQQQATQDFCT